MAKCDLSITLDEPGGVFPGGGKISGTVHVNADADVKCKGLDVSTVWKTHGRGNVASGTVESITVFSGEWVAGQTESYRFELNIADWPPSYHGNYLNIDHYVEARAKIPWAFDPKASVEFLMQPTCGPDEAKTPSASKQLSGAAGCLIGGFFAVVFLGIFIGVCAGIVGAGMNEPIFLIIGGAVVSLIVGFIGLKFYLPRYLLGPVHCELQSTQVFPGGHVNGELKVRPKRNVPINAVTMKFVGEEVCVSGSGSNRTTHRNTFYEKETILEPEGVMQAGSEKTFPLSVPLPGDVPYSIDLSDNDIRWRVTVRIDIPKWPDWSQSFDIAVVPSGEQPQPLPPSEAEATMHVETVTSEHTTDESGLTFAETAAHIWSSRSDRDQVDLLVEAVTGLTFDIDANVERRLLYSGDEDPHVYADGYAVWAHYIDPPLPLVLYVPHDLADEFEQIGRDSWHGRGTVVGWDHQHRRLQIKLLPG